MKLRRIVADLSGRSHHRAVGVLLAQIDAAIAGVELAAALVDGRTSPPAARAEMAEVEHTGDAQRAALVSELSAALTTPIDREDLFRLSRSVDDVLDNLRDYVRETDLYAVDVVAADRQLLDTVGEGLRSLRTAVRHIVSRPTEVTTAALVTRKRAGRVRALYQSAMAELLSGQLDTMVLKRRELLRRLDLVGLRLGECADALSDAMLKRSH